MKSSGGLGERNLSFSEIRKRGAITDADVARLRRDMFPSGVTSDYEADALFALNDACPIKDIAWQTFFVGALSEYTVHRLAPSGYVTVENAAWLIARITNDLQVTTLTELDLLITVLDKARWSPSGLSAFALEQVKRSIITGSGLMRSSKRSSPGVVDTADCDLLFRILCAFGGDAAVPITQAEAEVLFDINDATRDARNAPAWLDLFTKAIANFLMAASGYAVPLRQEALWREAGLGLGADRAPTAWDADAQRLLARLMAGGLQAMLDVHGRRSAADQALVRLEREKIDLITSERLPGEASAQSEADWLAGRLSRNGDTAKVSRSEQVLLTLIAERGMELHPALRALGERVA